MLCGSISFSQEKQFRGPLLKINATSIIDIFTFPSLQFSYEKPYKKNFSIHGEAGFQFYDFRKNDTSFINAKGWIVNAEVRYYGILKLLKIPAKNYGSLTGVYVFSQAFYRRNRFNTTIEYKKANVPMDLQDVLIVFKRNYGLNFGIGYQEPWGKSVMVDVYAGIGPMHLKITNTNREVAYNDSIPGNGLVPLMIRRQLSESSGLQASVIAGIRVGYRL